ncbi:IRAK4 kinase, partial [Amia calva]|nr:IRAK4 kinase [Amia calva]
MSNPITPSTSVRSLNLGLVRQLSDFLDPQDGWKKVAVDIQKPTGQPRYTQLHLRRFERVSATGKSPTAELIFDWGTTNCTVGDLVDILIRNHHVVLMETDVGICIMHSLQKFGKCFSPALLCKRCLYCSADAVNEFQVSPSVCQSTQETFALGHTQDAPQLPDSTTPPDGQEDFGETGFHRFSFNELMKLTSNFDERPVSEGGNKLGEGGFGVVYRAYFNKKVVAVKKLTTASVLQNAIYTLLELKLQFIQEIQTLKTLQHENLVEMVGFADDGEHPCLVYLYMSNGSLLDRLACLDGSPPLPWSTRCSIAEGTASGLEYLHANHHIHRDIKSGNILLDKMFVPKISDFGLTRASAKQMSTVMTERIVGTTAYMSPEALRGEITMKSDVFSFGVV